MIPHITIIIPEFLQRGLKRGGEYIACYVPFFETIFLTQHGNESNIERTLEHEYLHYILQHFVDSDTSGSLDNIVGKLMEIRYLDLD